MFYHSILDLFENELQPIKVAPCNAIITGTAEHNNNRNRSSNWCNGKIKFMAAYGQTLNPPVWKAAFRPNAKKNPSKAVHQAFGCSMSKKYCVGEIQAIPCCTKIAYDVWYKLDEYLTKYNVTYSLRWGSLLFAVRNGRHMPWDGRDIDIGFMRPERAARRAVAEFLNQHKVVQDGEHFVDVGYFYTLHHKQYGYPDADEEHCFVNFEFTMEIDEYFDAETLMLAGNMFIDYGYGDDGANGMDTEHDGNNMISIEYDGSNGIKAPRQLYTYPDFYAHLNAEYGKWTWMDSVPPYITDKQLEVM